MRRIVDDVLEPLGELQDRFLHAAHLVLGQVEEALLCESLHPLPVAPVDVLTIELLADGAFSMSARSCIRRSRNAPRRFPVSGSSPPKRAFEPFHLPAERPEPERRSQRMRELPFLKAMLDVAQLRALRCFTQELLQPAGVGTEKRFRQLRELDPLLFEKLFQVLEHAAETRPNRARARSGSRP